MRFRLLGRAVLLCDESFVLLSGAGAVRCCVHARMLGQPSLDSLVVFEVRILLGASFDPFRQSMKLTVLRA